MPDIRSRKHAHSILVQIASHAFALLAAQLQFSILDLVFTQESSLMEVMQTANFTFSVNSHSCLH
jgi:hypothetical protein